MSPNDPYAESKAIFANMGKANYCVIPSKWDILRLMELNDGGWASRLAIGARIAIAYENHLKDKVARIKALVRAELLAPLPDAPPWPTTNELIAKIDHEIDVIIKTDNDSEKLTEDDLEQFL